MRTIASLVLVSTIVFGVAQSVNSQEEAWENADRIEIKLVDPLDEPRGWCVDLFAHLRNALPLGGFQGHNCFLDMQRGPTEDQGFDAAKLDEQGILHLAYWDVCLTLHDPNPRSFVAAESCIGEAAQEFEWNSDGQIIPKMAPELCLTLGSTTIPGGGRLAPVGARPPKDNVDIPQIRRLSFETCNDENAVLQRWEPRREYERVEATFPSRFLDAN
ncbi:MAG TPA: hypothetical protein DCY55_02570 [Gammaproteobacteria bacterium]|jgi:hypothetical protein|nr:hypothetical protein [Pseudomonadota bacterium]HAY45148.1 hypothetical protein [Gammaproteobacteria bacterium]